MKITIITIISILLAIPTYGLSIIIWIYIKYRIDKFLATKILIPAVIASFQNDGAIEIRYNITNMAVRMLFGLFNGKIIKDDIENSVSGIFPHPTKDIILLVTMTQVSGNKLLIKAIVSPSNIG